MSVIAKIAVNDHVLCCPSENFRFLCAEIKVLDEDVGTWAWETLYDNMAFGKHDR